jgi:uncharacterized protein YbaR (Trm112 family)
MTTETRKPAQDQIGATDPDEVDTGVDPRLLEVLICPVSRGPLIYDRDANELISRQAGLAFPIRNGVPIMLRDEARDLTTAGK